jgi:hypothetical protein
MTTHDNPGSIDDSSRKAALSRRLEGIGWGVLLITIGTIWLLPERQIPRGSWLIAAGLIILAFSVVRHLKALTVSGFSLAVGLLALLAGLGEFFSLELPLLAIVLIGLGTCLLFVRLLEKDPTSTADRGWRCCWRGEQEDDGDAAPGSAGGR